MLRFLAVLVVPVGYILSFDCSMFHCLDMTDRRRGLDATRVVLTARSPRTRRLESIRGRVSMATTMSPNTGLGDPKQAMASRASDNTIDHHTPARRAEGEQTQQG